MSQNLPIEHQIAIQNVLSELCNAVDSRNAEQLVALVSEDCTFDVGMGPAVGRNAIKAAFEPRAHDRSYVARHTWSNLRIVAVRNDEVDVHTIFTTFAMIDLDTERTQIWRAGDAFDTLRQQDDGSWLLSARRLDAVIA